MAADSVNCPSCQDEEITLVESTSPPSKFVQLPADVHLLVLSLVRPIDLIRGLSRVSSQFFSLATNAQLWMSQCRELSGGSDVPTLTLHQMQRYCLFEEAQKSNGAENSETCKEELTSNILPASVLVSKCFAVAKGKSVRVCLATTTDRENERLENVLQTSDVDDDVWDSILSSGPYRSLVDRPAIPIWQEGTYWSSAAAASESDEVLLFTTRCPLALMSDVAIKPFREGELSFLGMDDEKTYTWPGIVIRVYRLPVGGKALRDPSKPEISSGFPCVISNDTQLDCDGENDPGSLCAEDKTAKTALSLDQNEPQRRLITSILAGQEPVYESTVHTPSSPGSDAWQHYPLPPLTAGNLITLTLVGKHHRQFPTSGFYVCVDKVAVRGIPLFSNKEQAALMGHRFQRL